MPRCFLATKSRPPKNAAAAAASRCSSAAAAVSASAAAVDAAGRNNRSTIGSISAAQAVQSIQQPVPRAPQPGGLLASSVPLPAEALERPRGCGGVGGVLHPEAAVPHTPSPPVLSTMTPQLMPPQPAPPLVTPATLQVKQEADCTGECEETIKNFATAVACWCAGKVHFNIRRKEPKEGLVGYS